MAKFEEPAPLSEVNEQSFTGLRQLLRKDLAALRFRMGRAGPYLFPQFTAVVLYRISRLLRRLGLASPARAVCSLNQLLTGAELDPIAVIGPGFVIAHTNGVLIGQMSVVGSNLFIHGGAVLGSTSDGFPVIGNDVVLYAKCSVIGKVTVGDGSVVGAHALVLADVPENHVARGIPARSAPVNQI